MKHFIIKFVLKICKVDQTTLIDIHDEATYGKAYIDYVERYRKHVYDNEPCPTELISTDWWDSPTLQKLTTLKKTKELIQNC
jgi:hypothetical protein